MGLIIDTRLIHYKWVSVNGNYPDVFLNPKRVLKKLHDEGINIALGTNSGAPGVVVGKAVHKELELMVEAGLSPKEAIIAGTKNAA